MNKILWVTRIFLFYMAIIPVTIVVATIGSFCAPLPANWRYWVITRWSHFFIWWAKIMCGLKYRIQGLENLPNQPAVVLCNHQSTWETIFMQVLLPPQSWVLKKELLWIPFFGWGLALLKPIAINRNNKLSVKTLLKQGCARLQQGRWVLIYPEGTRVPPGVKKHYSRTGAALALTANVPLVPIVHNAGLFWPRGPWIKKSGTIDIIIGKPINLTNKDAQELTQTIENWTRKQYTSIARKTNT